MIYSYKIGMLLDTVISIDHFNGIAAATDFILKHRHDVALSVITCAEVLVGFHPVVPIDITRLLEQFPLFEIDRKTAELAAQLRYCYRWKLPDAFQAVLAKQHGCQLVTRNTKDFDSEKHDFIVVPYRL